ncbi:MAG TPA: serine/threonine-protein kinase, partial [Polyangiales bacterium]|nr:serine/threonine-protein kinase [Polyangiales bacterium]
IAGVHLITAAVIAVAVVIAWRGQSARSMRIFGPVISVIYMWHAAACVSIDQLTLTSVAPYIGYCLGIAVVVSLSRRAALVVYGLGLTAYVLGILALQPSASVQLAILPNGITSSAVGILLAALLYAARERDFLQRFTIERQRAELAALNHDLERRVQAQVSEIKKRADEVEQLNAQLRSQVRERSHELSLALAKLSGRDHDASLREGSVLADRFEVERLIGQGGMGSVYSGLDRSTGSRVAIKVIEAVSAKHTDALARFLREARAAASVAHPGIVRMLHVDVSEDGVVFQVQELIVGESLQARLRPDVQWDPLVAARLGSTLCAALAAAHAEGVVHRDVKPGNIMLTRVAPGLKLLDFGISKLTDGAASHERATRAGMVLGTPAYMAPEQLDESREVGDRVDVYAVGVLMFLLLSGTLPFRKGDVFSAIMERQSTPPPKLRSLVPMVPDAVETVVAACLSRDPHDRPSAQRVADALARYADLHGAASLEQMEQSDRLCALEAPTPSTWTIRSLPARKAQ